MQSIEIEMQRGMEVESGQKSAVASVVPQRKVYWFDRDKILRTKRFYWMGRRAGHFLFPVGFDCLGCSYADCSLGDLD